MNEMRDVWMLVHDWRYRGKLEDATPEELYWDAQADLLERAIERSRAIPLSRYEAVLQELAVSEAKLAKVSDKARELLDMCIVAFVRIANHPSVITNIGNVEPMKEIANKAIARLKGDETP